jgi:hypothetical protein
MADVGQEFSTVLDDFGKASKEKFAFGLKQIVTDKPVKLGAVQRVVRSFGRDKSLVLDKLKTARNAIAVDLSDDVLEKAVGLKQGNITFDESRKLNSLLNEVTSGQIAEVGQGSLRGAFDNMHTNLMKSLEKTSEGTKQLYKDYADSVNLYKDVKSFITKKGTKGEELINEAGVEALGYQLLGGDKARSQQVKILKRLSEKTGVPLDELLKDAVARKALEKGGAGSLPRQLISGSFLAPAAYALTGGSPIYSVGGFGAGKLVDVALGNKNVLSAYIGASRITPQIARLGTTPLRVGTASALAQAMEPIKTDKKKLGFE